MSIYQFTVKKSSGLEVPLETYKGKVLLIVNTASKCGLTPQFEGLQALYKEYEEGGFSILGFPCSQFANQEYSDAAETESFCQLNYGVEFPMFGKIDVNGSSADPLFTYLTSEKKGAFGIKKIKWNFTKFLVDQNGKVIKRYAPQTKPVKIAADIERLL